MDGVKQFIYLYPSPGGIHWISDYGWDYVNQLMYLYPCSDGVHGISDYGLC